MISIASESVLQTELNNASCSSAQNHAYIGIVERNYGRIENNRQKPSRAAHSVIRIGCSFGYDFSLLPKVPVPSRSLAK